MKTKLGVLFGGLLCAGFLAAASTSHAAVSKVRTVVWQGDPGKYHTAISGQAAQLKAVIDTNDTSTVYYKWVYGDGTPDSAVTPLSGKTKYNVKIDHTYTAAPGTPFAAKLIVGNESTLVSGTDTRIQDTYLVKIEDGTSLDVQVNIAIDKGLWWLYTNAYSNDARYGTLDSYFKTYDGSTAMGWWQSSYVGTQASPTASAVQAFGINGHKAHNDPNQDPYVEAVVFGMNLLSRGYGYNNSGCPDLQAVAIGTAPHGGNPEAGQAAPNGYGIQVYECRDHQPYQSGQIMDAIIASGYAPGDSTGRDFAPSTPQSHIWTYGELLQDMADMHAWGQYDYGPCNGGVCGSWWYNWNYGYPGDNSASQWGAIGMLPAQEAPWNVIVPQWVKDYNANWLAYSMGCSGPSSAVTACSYNYFSYNGVSGCAGDNCQQTTTSGMVQMIFDGQTTSDLKWGKAQKKIADEWRSFLHQGSTWGGYRTYGWYSFAKAMRLSKPTATTQLVKTSGATFDWYYGDTTTTTCTTEENCEKGLAKRILEIQSADGSWQSGNLTNPPLTTAWMIISLNPALFAAAPIACFDYNPKSTYSDDTITFDPSCSGHSETGKTIANLTKFEWDWNNDGTYDDSTTTPINVAQEFTCASPPCTYPVTLRVSDDENPALTATVKQNVEITNPPHPPSADAGGPYMTSFCPADVLKLDGSASVDPNEGLHKAGCTTCPNDTITAWGWDLVPPLTGFGDASGEMVTLNAATIATDFVTPGSHQIGLQVTDNTLLSFPDSGKANLTDADFADVMVYDDCICTLVARPKVVSATDVKIQLTWTHTGAASYDIYRSTEGPNSGFALIAGDVVTTYATYMDTNVQVGTTYWYRVVNDQCGSQAASAKPALRLR